MTHNLSKSLVDAASGILKKELSLDQSYHQLLAEWNVSSPFELSDKDKVVFLKKAEEILGEGYIGLRKLKERVLLSEAINPVKKK